MEPSASGRLTGRKGTPADHGPSAAGFAVGDRVIALTRFGGYSSHLSVRQEQVFALPPGLDFAQGAALPVTYLTAYQLVIAMGRLRAGETMLVHSAAGESGFRSSISRRSSAPR